MVLVVEPPFQEYVFAPLDVKVADCPTHKRVFDVETPTTGTVFTVIARVFETIEEHEFIAVAE